MPTGHPAKIFVSARESSGDMYAASFVEAIRHQWPQTEWFGSAGPRMQQAGVRPVVDSRSLSVVGLVEVVRHLPEIYGEYRLLLDSIRRERPELVVLTDSPDFHLRMARRVHEMGIPVIYLVAPQAWAWRQGRVKQMRRHLRRLLCLFPFEEDFYRRHGVPAYYIGHPLAGRIRPSMDKAQFFARHRLPDDRPVIALCPGSRPGEIARHLPPLLDATRILNSRQPVSTILAAPFGFSEKSGNSFFSERISSASIQVIEGETWDVLAHADVALAASGTVTMEAALLGTPVVTYYKVTAASWFLGKLLVRVPFYSMVNLIAGKRLATELMQNEMTGDRLADETTRLLQDRQANAAMRAGLAEVAAKLTTQVDPMARAADIVKESFDELQGNRQ